MIWQSMVYKGRFVVNESMYKNCSASYAKQRCAEEMAAPPHEERMRPQETG